MEFKEGDRVWCYDLDMSKVSGTIHRNVGYEHVSEWYIKYDDGMECAVLNLDVVFPDVSKLKPGQEN